MGFFESFFGRAMGAIASAIFKKIAYKLPNLNGSWVYEQVTTQSAFNPYTGMKLRYLVLLTINENEISGTAEKFWEFSVNGGERDYAGKNRSTATISGHVKRKIFGQHELIIHLNENGHGRQYSTQHILTVTDKNLLSGRFSSTAANQIGTCKWNRRTT